ncbi:MAG TPA: hypothetical protein VEF71_22755 [Streptosporangiaceae bacterium]|nr:hypothetical protein [Streptosporangiaceae bacterium]
MTSKPGGYALPFPDRRAAGLLLAERLAAGLLLAERLADSVALDRWAGRTMVLGLPRGGVAVAQQVAAVLGLPMDVIVTRKIGYPPSRNWVSVPSRRDLASRSTIARCSSGWGLPRRTWPRWWRPRRPNSTGGSGSTAAATRYRRWRAGA